MLIAFSGFITYPLGGINDIIAIGNDEAVLMDKILSEGFDWFQILDTDDLNVTFGTVETSYIGGRSKPNEAMSMKFALIR